MGGRGQGSAAAREANKINGSKRTITGFSTRNPFNRESAATTKMLADWKYGKNKETGVASYKEAQLAQLGQKTSARGKELASGLESFLEGKSYTKGDILRGVSLTDKEIRDVQNGKLPKWLGSTLSSWTTQNKDAYEFAVMSSDRRGGRPVVFVMEGGTKHGTYIENLWGGKTTFAKGESGRFVGKTEKTEHEVLVSSKSKASGTGDTYKVNGWGGEALYVHLKELRK